MQWEAKFQLEDSENNAIFFLRPGSRTPPKSIPRPPDPRLRTAVLNWKEWSSFQSEKDQTNKQNKSISIYGKQ